MSNLTRAKMASYIPGELTVEDIRWLMVTPSDSEKATPEKWVDGNGTVHYSRLDRELSTKRIEQLDKKFQAVIGADYERRRYSVFLDMDFPESDRMSVTLKGNEAFYDLVMMTITDLASQELPVSTRLRSVFSDTQYGLRATEYCTVPNPNRDHV